MLEDTGQADFAVTVVREAIAADPRLAGRLALWGRRLVGEAITQAQRVGVERDALASILVGAPGRAGADLAELGRMFAGSPTSTPAAWSASACRPEQAYRTALPGHAEGPDRMVGPLRVVGSVRPTCWLMRP